jgi:hypothetical protein
VNLHKLKDLSRGRYTQVYRPGYTMMSLLTTQTGSEKPTNKTVFRDITRCLKLTEQEATIG